jgi:hypothetical protein
MHCATSCRACIKQYLFTNHLKQCWCLWHLIFSSLMNWDTGLMHT